jgi:hypothetical protein
LIKLPLSQALGVERNRHDGIEFLPRQPRVGEALKQNPTKDFHNPNLAIVFNAVDQFANHTAAAHYGHRAVEVKRRPPAIRALELAGHSIEWLRADLAARGLDEFDGSRARRAEILPGFDPHRTTSAMRRKEKGGKCFKNGVRHGEGKPKQRAKSQEERKPE